MAATSVRYLEQCSILATCCIKLGIRRLEPELFLNPCLLEQTRDLVCLGLSKPALVTDQSLNPIREWLGGIEQVVRFVKRGFPKWRSFDEFDAP